ncbi:SusC/RagA family TonB-linked outer membrane protein [Mariniphaga sediminis]|uniref:SusC/RagA family TonB-linked outer membrane protein n=1 Tax=Mariniphaga sediminis TaxID=1628158 RepID=A0A399CS50_9BACT|nr:SusC/RagA family TonB-linked outer membrane protein [Mariniphaga sediminis]RIH62924.1 SusC/RagA family TonB-linked outer membrane protein [Mariniphaga sediminis]
MKKRRDCFSPHGEIRKLKLSLKKMKLTLIFSMLTLLTFGNGFSQVKVTLHFEKASIQNVLETIENQTGYVFLYKDEIFNPDQKYSVDFTDEPFNEVIKSVCEKAGVEYEVRSNRQIILTEKGQESLLNINFQQKTVTGMVTDQSGLPLPGVTVVVPGTTTGTVTNADGNFSLAVPDGTEILQFSFVGMQTQEVSIAGRTTFTVVLEEETIGIEEVVAIGYGTVKRTDLTGSVGQVSSDNLKDLNISNTTQALAGQISGVSVQQGSGSPGKGAIIRVRGAASITANSDPLYVIDGFPITGDLSVLNPNDIASIEVLKDASASAIYGSRASNGVILITTKSGKKGEAKIQFDSYVGFQTVAKTLDLMNAQEFIELNREAFNTKYIESVPGAKITDPVVNRPSGYRYKYPDFYDDPAAVAAVGNGTDWQDEIFRSAPIQNYQLNVSGGSESTNYFFSAGYFNQEGIIINSNFERFSLRAKIDTKITDRLTAGINLAPNYSINNDIAEGHPSNGVIIQALAIAPWIPVRYDNGVYGTATDYGKAGGDGITGIVNAVATATHTKNQSNRLQMFSNAYAELSLLSDKSLKLRTSIGATITNYRRNYFRAAGLMPIAGNPGLGLPQHRRAESDAQETFNYLNENTLSYSKTLNEKHNFDAVAGFTVQKQTWMQTYANGSDFPDDIIEVISNATIRQGSSNINEWAMMSYLGRLNYNYNNKYYVTASFRSDGSSKFGKNNRFGNFPSMSLMWRAIEEDFIKNGNLFSDLRLRASYGVTGNDNLSNNYAAIGTIATSNYAFGAGSGVIVNGANMNSISNHNLTWEKASQLDLGLEFGFFDNKLTFLTDFYSRKTTDLLLNVPVPTITGFSNAYQNIGRVDNWGLEFNIRANAINTNDFSWLISANLSMNRNEVKALGPSGDPIYYTGQTRGEGHVLKIGFPMGTFYGYDHIGVYMNQEMFDENPKEATSHVGDAMYRDVNGDKVITAADRTEIGKAEPDFYYGINNSFSYKNFDLGILIQGSYGGEILHIGKRYYENLEGNQNQLRTVLNRWRSEEDPGDGWIPRVRSTPTGQTSQISTRWVEDGSYLRVNNITLGYSFSNTTLSKLNIENMRVNISAQNPITITNYSGFNPEVNTSENTVLAGSDHGVYPLSKSFTLGLNITF